MLRLIAAVTCIASAEFTLEKLGEMSTSIQKTADELQDKVASLGKEIAPLTVKITTFPGKAATASDEEKATLEKQMKADAAQMCTVIDSLKKVQADVEKQAGETKDTMAQITSQVVEMSSDPEKLKDVLPMHHYLTEFQMASETLDVADNSAKMYTGPMPFCEKDATGEPAATRLFLEMGQLSRPTFHLPSALLGAVGATVIGAALVVFRTMGKSRSSQVALMEEGNLEWRG